MAECPKLADTRPRCRRESSRWAARGGGSSQTRRAPRWRRRCSEVSSAACRPNTSPNMDLRGAEFCKRMRIDFYRHFQPTRRAETSCDCARRLRFLTERSVLPVEGAGARAFRRRVARASHKLAGLKKCRSRLAVAFEGGNSLAAGDAIDAARANSRIAGRRTNRPSARDEAANGVR